MDNCKDRIQQQSNALADEYTFNYVLQHPDAKTSDIDSYKSDVNALISKKAKKQLVECETLSNELSETYDALQKESDKVLGMQTELDENQAKDLIGIIKRVGKDKGDISNITIEQYKALTNKSSVSPNILTKDKKHVKWEYSLDQLASERGYEDDESLRDGIVRAKDLMDKIDDSKQYIKTYQSIANKAKKELSDIKVVIKPDELKNFIDSRKRIVKIERKINAKPIGFLTGKSNRGKAFHYPVFKRKYAKAIVGLIKTR